MKELPNINTKPTCAMCGQLIEFACIETTPPTCATCLSSCNMTRKQQLDPAAFIAMVSNKR